MKYLMILPFFLLLACSTLNGDATYLKDGREIKGVIVEDYHDRIVISTEKGEVCFLKKDIEKISYDAIEENLVKLGAFYKDKGDYEASFYYYNAAYKLNPEMKEAQDGTLLLSSMIFGKRERDLDQEVKLKQDIEEKKGKQAGEGLSEAVLDIKKKELWDRIGISIVGTTSSDIRVDKVLKNSQADEAGIKGGDIIVSVWGKLIKYMQLKSVYDLLLDSKINELKIEISRGVPLVLNKDHLFGGAEEIIGGRLKMTFEGLAIDRVKPDGILEKAGILNEDRIIKIGNFPTRYVPLEVACKLIEERCGDLIVLEIQRELVFWKK